MAVSNQLAQKKPKSKKKAKTGRSARARRAEALQGAQAAAAMSARLGIPSAAVKDLLAEAESDSDSSDAETYAALRPAAAATAAAGAGATAGQAVMETDAAEGSEEENARGEEEEEEEEEVAVAWDDDDNDGMAAGGVEEEEEKKRAKPPAARRTASATATAASRRSVETAAAKAAGQPAITLSTKLPGSRAAGKAAGKAASAGTMGGRGDAATGVGRGTLSLAVPASMLARVDESERLHAVGCLARAVAAFAVDEVVVYGEPEANTNAHAAYLTRMLQYLECPPRLRPRFFASHPDLTAVDRLYALKLPHHEADPQQDFVEGVTVPGAAQGTTVDLGEDRTCTLSDTLQPGLRVTIKLAANQTVETGDYKGQVVAPNQPQATANLYWGYTVRRVADAGAIGEGAPWKEGYDRVMCATPTGRRSLPPPKPVRHTLLLVGSEDAIALACESVKAVGVVFSPFTQTSTVAVRPEELAWSALAALAMR